MWRNYKPVNRYLCNRFKPFLPSFVLSRSKSSGGMSWASSTPVWHWFIDISLYCNLWEKKQGNLLINQPITLDNKNENEAKNDLLCHERSKLHETLYIISLHQTAFSECLKMLVVTGRSGWRIGVSQTFESKLIKQHLFINYSQISLKSDKWRITFTCFLFFLLLFLSEGNVIWDLFLVFIILHNIVLPENVSVLCKFAV